MRKPEGCLSTASAWRKPKPSTQVSSALHLILPKDQAESPGLCSPLPSKTSQEMEEARPTSKTRAVIDACRNSGLWRPTFVPWGQSAMAHGECVSQQAHQPLLCFCPDGEFHARTRRGNEG